MYNLTFVLLTISIINFVFKCISFQNLIESDTLEIYESNYKKYDKDKKYYMMFLKPCIFITILVVTVFYKITE